MKSKKRKSFIGLLGCTVFLIGNMVYAYLDHPTPGLDCPYDPGAADPRIYFISLFLMLDVLLFLAHDNFKELNKFHDISWVFFVMLSGNQTFKNIVGPDPTKEQISDYVFLGFCLIYSVVRIVKKKI